MGAGAGAGGRPDRLGRGLPARRGGGRPVLPARGRPGAARVHPAVRPGPGADRGPGPVPDARPPGRAELLGGPGRAAAAAQPGEHLPRVRRRPRLPGAIQRRPEPVDRAGRAPAQQGADRPARQAGVASRQGLGGGDRAGDPGAGRPARPAGGDLVGPGRAEPGAAAARRRPGGVGPPQPDVGGSGVLRLPAVQPGQRDAPEAGRRGDRLEAPVAALAGRFGRDRASGQNGAMNPPADRIGDLAGAGDGSEAAGGTAPFVAVSGLAVSFGSVRALDGVDLEVMPGEVVALAGEIAPTSGQILLGGRPLPPDPLSAARRGVGVVWQDLALCENLDIASNLLLGRERRRQLLSDVRMHADAAALLARLGIPLADTTRTIRALSGGQRQLVAIARAMVGEPALLLLDEPTASLSLRHAAQVEELIAALRERATTIVIACHDIDLMFRLADRIVVLRHGRVAAEADPAAVHPDLVAADPSSSLSLILSALGAALGSDRLCIHLAAGGELACAASFGLPDALLARWSRLPAGPDGGPVGLAASVSRPVIVEDAAAGWGPFAALAASCGIASSWSVPVLARDGLAGVITGFSDVPGKPERDQLDLVTVYSGYAASAIERDRLLDEVTERNRELETIREVLETLAGPIAVGEGLGIALQALCAGLQADEVRLLTWSAEGEPRCRARAVGGGERMRRAPPRPRGGLPAVTDLFDQRHDGTARQIPGEDGRWYLAVTFGAPGGPSVLLASWRSGPPTTEAAVLAEDAAHSLRLALEREQAGLALQEATALRRSQELQREFLTRLSHELRTPLTAIRGYATSLLQPDVTWDADSQQRFLARIATESARLGRLVDDLLDFSAIELGILRLQPDWCDLSLVLEAAAACLPPERSAAVGISCAPGLPVVWADHDRLEQVFVNLLGNAFAHNPPGTAVRVRAEPAGAGMVAVTVADDGVGLPPEVAAAPFEPRRGRRTRSAGAGLGLSIARGIVAAHGGRIDVRPADAGTCFVVLLPVEDGARGEDGTRPGTAVPEWPAVAGRAARAAPGRGRPGGRARRGVAANG